MRYASPAEQQAQRDTMIQIRPEREIFCGLCGARLFPGITHVHRDRSPEYPEPKIRNKPRT